jgi:hypothetical protein
MSSNRKSFLLHIDSLDILDELTDEEAGQLFKAIHNYQKCEELDIHGLVRIAFSPFKNQFNRDNVKYENLCEKNRLIAVNRHSTKSTSGRNGNQSLPKATKSTDNDSDSKNDSDSDSKDIVTRVFKHWCLAMNKKSNTKLTDGRKKSVKARLKDGYSESDIITAIDSCSKSSYHMGKNDTGTIYDDLTLICRNGEKLEGFINNKDRAINKTSSTKPSIEGDGTDWRRFESEML